MSQRTSLGAAVGPPTVVLSFLAATTDKRRGRPDRFVPAVLSSAVTQHTSPRLLKFKRQRSMHAVAI